MICVLLRVLDEFNFHLVKAVSLSSTALFNLKSDREELQGKASKNSDIGSDFF